MRLLTAAIASLGAATCVFLILAFAHLVSTTTLALASLLAAVYGIRSGRHKALRQWLSNDKRALQTILRGLPWPVICVMLAVLITLFILDCASLATPILGWDSLHYHLVHVAYWAQDGGFSQHPGADAWSYYAFYPIGGEILWAWVTIPLRCSALVGTAGIAVVLLAALATLVCARSLGASRVSAMLAGCAVASNPAVVRFGTNGYVDNVLLAYIATSLALVFRAQAATRWRTKLVLCLFSSIASGLALLTKISAIPAVGLVWLAVFVVVMHHRIRMRTRLLSLLILTLTPISIFGPAAVSNWMHTGSPTYPLQLSVAGKTLFTGNHQLTAMLQGHFLIGNDVPLRTLVRRLFFDTYTPQSPHTNFGAGGLLVVSSGLLGLASWLTRRPRERQWLLLVALAATCVPLFVDPNLRAMRMLWWWVTARLMLTTLFAFAVFAASIRTRIASIALALASVIQLPSDFNLGFCNYRWLSAVVCGATICVASILIVWFCRTGARRACWTALGTVVTLIGLELALLRPELEPLAFAGAVREQCFEAHPLYSTNMATHIWAKLRDAPARTIAVIAGFDGTGHGVFRYPLLGSHWQHHLVYVPPASDGKLRNYEELYMPAAQGPINRVPLSYKHWINQLIANKVTHVVLYGPPNIVEWGWIARHTSQFTLEEAGDLPGVGLFAFHPQLLR